MWEPGLALEENRFLSYSEVVQKDRKTKNDKEKWWSRKDRSRGSSENGLDVLRPEILFYYLLVWHPCHQKYCWEKQINQIYFLHSNSWAYHLIRNRIWKRGRKEDTASPSQVVSSRNSGNRVFERDFAAPHPRPFSCKVHLYRRHYILYMLLNPEIKSPPLLNISSFLVIWEIWTYFEKESNVALLTLLPWIKFFYGSGLIVKSSFMI